MVEAQQLILEAWALVVATLLGLGLLERRLLGPPLTSARDLWLTFWMGWGLLLVALEFWHLFLPVDDRARIALVALGSCGWLVSGLAPWRAVARALPRNIVAFVGVALCAWWLSDRAMAGPTFGDTGLYLVPAVHWVESFRIVPGLANLYVPLGHNNTYFLYAAFLDAGPFATRFYHLVNSLLVFALVARGLFAAGSLLRQNSSNSAGDMFYALSLIPALELVQSLYFSSPMPDTAVDVFGLVLAGELVELAAASQPSRAQLLRLIFLAGVGVTVKLSLAAVALMIAVMAALLWCWRMSTTAADAMRVLALCALVGFLPTGVWLVRSALMSGFPFYPAQLFPLPVDWVARVDATAWVQAPMAMAPLYSIFTDPAWWRIRLESLGWFEPDVMRPLAMIATALVVFAVAKAIQWRRGRRSTVSSLLLLIPIASFFYSFANAPMPRYQGATLWIFAIDLVVMGLALAGDLDGGARLRRAAVAGMAGVGAWLQFQRGGPALLHLQDFEITSPPRVHDEKVASGLVVGMPENQVCWWAPLPCSPEIHPGLRLREPGNLGAGFAIDLPAVAPTPPAGG